MNNTYKVKEYFENFDKYNNYRLVIETGDKNFEIIFDKYSLPHLLGLHYMNEKSNEFKKEVK